MADFWNFGRTDDPSPETHGSVPPGFRLARAVPRDAPYGKMLACRSCGALVAATDNAVNRHTTFHNRLGALVAGNLDMNYDPGNLPFTEAQAGYARVRALTAPVTGVQVA